MNLNLLKIESFKKGVALSTLFNFISRLLLFLQSIVVAYYFGASVQTDVYLYCFSIVTLFSVFVNALDSAVLIPESMRLRARESSEATIFLNFFLLLYGGLGAVITVLFCLMPVDMFRIGSQFEEATLTEHIDILLLMAPLFMFTIVTNLLVNILASYRFFTIPMMVSAMNGIMALIFLFVFHQTLGIRSAVLGLLFSYGVNLIFLVLLMKNNLHWRFTFALPKLNKLTISNMLFAQAGNVTTLFASSIPIYMLSGFEPGAITAITFGQKTAEMPQQIITNQVSSVFGIKLNELFAIEKVAEVNQAFVRTAELILFVLIPISALLFVLSDSIVNLLYQHGNFRTHSAQKLSEFFRYFVLLLPMLAINTLVSRLLMAGRKIMAGFFYQVFFNLVLILFIYIGVEFWGPIGYPGALILLHFFNVLFCAVLLRMTLSFVDYLPVLRVFVALTVINLPLFAGAYYLQSSLQVFGDFFAIIIQCGLYAAAMLFLNHWFNISKEARQIVNSLYIKASNYARIYRK